MNFRKAIEPQRYKSINKSVTKELTKVMATEIKGETGDKLLNQVLELNDVDLPTEKIKKAKRIHRTKQMMPKEVIEGLYSEVITELKNAMNSIFLIFFDKETGDLESFDTQTKKLDSIKGTLLIFLTQLETVDHCLKNYSKATMNHRHYAVKEICSEGYNRLQSLSKEISKAKRMNHWAVIEFSKEMCQFITNFHTVLHKDTPIRERIRIVKEYCMDEEL